MSRLEANVADAVFLLAMAAPLFAGLWLVLTLCRQRTRDWRRAGWCSVALLATLACHPLVQLWVLEPYDEQRGLALSARATEGGLVGMAPAEVRGLLGEPTYVSQLDHDTTCWGYKQLPGYWLGSHFQVFIQRRSVTGFEANDD
jgi:hypothetical protein